MQGILGSILAVCLVSTFSAAAIAQNSTKQTGNTTTNQDNYLELLEFQTEPQHNYSYFKVIPKQTYTLTQTAPTQVLFKKYPPQHMAWQVFSEICNSGIREPQIVMSQALLETGQFKANFLMERNNLFGFRAQRYLSFNNWKDSVRYYRDWQVRRYKPSDKNYYAFLSCIRYGAPAYAQHLQQMPLWKHDCSVLNQLPSVKALALSQI